MPTQFDWQTDEEDFWRPEPSAVEQPELPRRWPRLLATLLVALAVGGFIYRQADRRVSERTAVLEGDVLATFNLLRQAAVRADRELLISLISGRDPGWTSAQSELLQGGLLLNPHTLGLEAQWGEPESVVVTLSPDLAVAQVVAGLSYTVQDTAGVTTTVQLEQSLLFRLGGEKWLFSPPEEDYWGATLAVQEGDLRLTYPQRDEAIARRLAQDLAGYLREMCRRMPDLNCPPNLQVTVSLDVGPTSLAALLRPETRLRPGRNVILPAPSLVGLPADEAGYQALLRGYAEYVLSPVIGDLVRWDCCDSHPLFYEALLYRVLDQLEVRPWPLLAADYEVLGRRTVSLGSMGDLWSMSLDEATADDRRRALATTEFLLDTANDVSPVTVQRFLQTRQVFWSWIYRWFVYDPASGSRGPVPIERRWVAFVAERIQAARPVPPIPLPDQDVQLLCGDGSQQSLYRYNVSSDNWSAQLQGRTFVRLASPSDDDGVILEERYRQGDDTDWSKGIIYWRDDRSTALYEGLLRSGMVVQFNGDYPGGRRLRLFTFDALNGPPSFHYLDLDECDTAGCVLNRVPAFPLWSPDGRHSLLWDLWNQQALFLGDGSGRPGNAIGIGVAPFWLDADTYGYISPGRAADQSVQELRLANVGEEPVAILTEAALLAAIPEVGRPETLAMSFVAASPLDLRRFYVAAQNPDSVTPSVYLFTFTWPDGSETPELLAPAASQPSPRHLRLLLTGQDTFATYPPFQISPDGRWLTTVTDSYRHPARVFYLYDLETEQTQRFESAPAYPYYDWSADGQWLLRAESNYVSLLAPAFGYQRLILNDFRQCSMVAWVNR